MPEFLFKLNNVPDDEAEEIRRILHEHAIDFYETSAGKWGVSSAAIWLPNNKQMQQALMLIHEYQQDRQNRVKMEYQQLQQEGKTESFLTRTWQRPIQSCLYIALILAILYISIKPFILFGQ